MLAYRLGAHCVRFFCVLGCTRCRRGRDDYLLHFAFRISILRRAVVPNRPLASSTEVVRASHRHLFNRVSLFSMSRIRVLAARFCHETNTFVPGVTGPEAFFQGEAGTPLSGFRRQIETLTDVSFEVSFCQAANPSGKVSQSWFDEHSDLLLRDIEKLSPNVILLDLHGALVTTESDDPEGDLLARVRSLSGPETMIGVALDLHGNLSEAMINNCDIVMGFETYPHIDMVETGERVARYVFRLLQERPGQRPTKMLVALPILASTLRSRTDVAGAMTDAVARARAEELKDSSGFVSVSVFAGFPICDIANVGASVVLYSFDESSLQRTAVSMASEMWDHRDGFVYTPEPMIDSLMRAKEENIDQGFTLLLDHGDNVFSGAPAAKTTVLRELIRLEMNPFVVGPICDAAIVEQAFADQSLTSFVFKDDGLKIEASVIYCSDGALLVQGVIMKGATLHMGRTVVLKLSGNSGSIVTVSEFPVEPFDLGHFHVLGLQDFESRFRFVVLKSRVYCRPVFEPLAKSVVEVDSRGPTTSDYSHYVYERVRRPIYPLDSFAAPVLTRAAVAKALKHAVASQKLGPIETKTTYLETSSEENNLSLRWGVHVVTSMEKKRAALQDQSSTSSDPFAMPDEDLIVRDCNQLPNHCVLLNKFPVLDNHVLLVTKEDRSQRESLTLQDFEALALIQGVEDEWLCFYNCGDESGRSQQHKHLQLVPYPLDAGITSIEDPNLWERMPFATASAPLVSWKDAKSVFEIYETLLKKIGDVRAKSHNVLLSPRRIVVVPRSQESCGDISVNALGYCFSLFAESEATVQQIESLDPLKILTSLGYPKEN